MNIDFINLWNHRRVIDLDVNVDIKGPQSNQTPNEKFQII